MEAIFDIQFLLVMIYFVIAQNLRNRNERTNDLIKKFSGLILSWLASERIFRLISTSFNSFVS